MRSPLLRMGAVLLALTLPPPAKACSCVWAGPFLKVAPATELVVRAKVLGYYGRSRGVDLAMDVEVLEVLKGSHRTGKLRVWGDNGFQCRPYVSRFPPGSEWIFAIARLTDKDGAAGDYDISVCGQFWARVENGEVIGRLTSSTPPGVKDLPERLPLQSVRERLRKRQR